jgi:hypothetical protein
MLFAALRAEAGVFKAVALSVALIVGVGPGAALLCRALCDQRLAAATGCHDPGHGDDRRVTTSGECDDLALVSSPFLLEDARRGVAPPADQALPGSEHDFIIRSFEPLPPHGAESGHPLQGPPLPLNLRI